MISISVSGAPGSGKTTLSMELLKNEKTKIVHLDHIMDHLKKALPKNNILTAYRAQGEECAFLNRDGLFYKMVHLKYINCLYERIREIYIGRELKRLWTIASQEGIDYFVVEGTKSDTFNDTCFFDFKILVLADNDLRLTRVRYRDEIAGIPLYEETLLEVKPANINYSDYDFVVDNNSTLNDYLVQINLIGDSIKRARGSIRQLEKNQQN